MDGRENGTSSHTTTSCKVHWKNSQNKKKLVKGRLEHFNALMIDVFRNCQEHGAAFDVDFLEEMKFRYASVSGQSAEEAEVIPVVTAQPTIVLISIWNCC